MYLLQNMFTSLIFFALFVLTSFFVCCKISLRAGFNSLFILFFPQYIFVNMI